MVEEQTESQCDRLTVMVAVVGADAGAISFEKEFIFYLMGGHWRF